MPLLALRIPVAVAAPLAVLVSVLVAAVIIAQDWRKIEVTSAAWLFAASLPGIPLGLLILTRVDDHIVKFVLGIIIALFAPLLAVVPIQAAPRKRSSHLARRRWLLFRYPRRLLTA